MTLDYPVTVNSVKIHGIAYTDHDFLAYITKPLLDAKNLEQVVIGSRNIAEKLQRLDIFQQVQVEIDSPNNIKESVDVIYTVKERKRLFARTGAEFGNKDGSLNFSINIRNVFGRAETLSAHTSYGVDTTETLDSRNVSSARSHQFALSKPINANPDNVLEISAYALDRNHAIFKPFSENLKGISLKIGNLIGMNARYNAGFDFVWRENFSLAAGASNSIRKDAGHSLKSSISHSLTYDTRDDAVLPNRGSLIRASQEIAGLGGNVKFFKNELFASASSSLRNASFHCSLRSGIILPLEKDCRIRINDKFFLGGPLSIRGFKQNGIGPRDGLDSLGGDYYFGFGCSSSFKLPMLPYHHIRGQLFANGGVLSRLETGIYQITRDLSIQDNFKRLFLAPSVAVGAGLCARFTSFRLELNYCLPLMASSTDSMNPGFQFGIGMEFL